jgi:hypothetical protein
MTLKLPIGLDDQFYNDCPWPDANDLSIESWKRAADFTNQFIRSLRIDVLLQPHAIQRMAEKGILLSDVLLTAVRPQEEGAPFINAQQEQTQIFRREAKREVGMSIFLILTTGHRVKTIVTVVKERSPFPHHWQACTHPGFSSAEHSRHPNAHPKRAPASVAMDPIDFLKPSHQKRVSALQAAPDPIDFLKPLLSKKAPAIIFHPFA